MTRNKLKGRQGKRNPNPNHPAGAPSREDRNEAENGPAEEDWNQGFEAEEESFEGLNQNFGSFRMVDYQFQQRQFPQQNQQNPQQYYVQQQDLPPYPQHPMNQLPPPHQQHQQHQQQQYQHPINQQQYQQNGNQNFFAQVCNELIGAAQNIILSFLGLIKLITHPYVFFSLLAILGSIYLHQTILFYVCSFSYLPQRIDQMCPKPNFAPVSTIVESTKEFSTNMNKISFPSAKDVTTGRHQMNGFRYHLEGHPEAKFQPQIIDSLKKYSDESASLVEKLSTLQAKAVGCIANLRLKAIYAKDSLKTLDPKAIAQKDLDYSQDIFEKTLNDSKDIIESLFLDIIDALAKNKLTQNALEEIGSLAGQARGSEFRKNLEAQAGTLSRIGLGDQVQYQKSQEILALLEKIISSTVSNEHLLEEIQIHVQRFRVSLDNLQKYVTRSTVGSIPLELQFQHIDHSIVAMREHEESITRRITSGMI